MDEVLHIITCLIMAVCIVVSCGAAWVLAFEDVGIVRGLAIATLITAVAVIAKWAYLSFMGV